MRALGLLLVLLAWLLLGGGASADGTHTQTVWDAAALARLRSARTSTHAALARNLRAYLDRHDASPNDVEDVLGFAMMARICGDRAPDTANAVAILMRHCAAPWHDNRDLEQSFDLFNGAVGYDVLYDLLTPAQRTLCRAKIAASARIMAQAVVARVWWTEDLVQNHNWVNFAALGVAGQALEGEDPDADRWQGMARLDFRRVRAVQDLVTDGSWHEGIGYLEFGLSHCLLYWLGAARRGNTDDKSRLLGHLGRYILYAQTPDHPRVHVMTHGDWNWSRPALVAVLRWAARRFHDPLAAEAARRWDGEPRRTRQEYGSAYALEYAAYDPAVAPVDARTLPLDVHNADQQSVLMRTSWDCGPGANGLVLGFKAGVFGGRGNFERMRDRRFPGGWLDFSHDHEDDLGLWIYGKGGWLLPGAVAYNCCDPKPDFHSTPWQNTFLFDGIGQVGDDKNGDGRGKPRQAGIACGTNSPPWFFRRQASLPLHASSDHYAFARAQGRRLYPAALGITTLLRTVGLSRENGGFVALQDRVSLGQARTIQQIFHSMTPSGTNNADSPWLKLANLNDTVLGVRVVAPARYTATVATQISNNWGENMDDDGRFGCVRVAPPAPQPGATFLEVLWPTQEAAWAQRPAVRPLDPAHPERGFSVPLGASVECWVYGTGGAGELRLNGAGPDGIGVTRMGRDGAPERLAIQGRGRLTDRGGRRLLLDTGRNAGALEVALTGGRADLSGTAGIVGVRFFGPRVTQVRCRGRSVRWARRGPLVTITGLTP